MQKPEHEGEPCLSIGQARSMCNEEELAKESIKGDELERYRGKENNFHQIEDVG